MQQYHLLTFPRPLTPYTEGRWCKYYLPTDYSHQLIGLVGRVFANGPGDLGSIPCQVIPKTLKMVIDTSLLNTQQYKVCIKGKVEQSRERSSALPLHLSVVAIEKGAFWSSATKVANFTFTYGLPKESITAIMMLYKNTKVKFSSLDGDTDYFDIVAGVLLGDTLSLYLFIICLDYGLQTTINLMKKTASRWQRKKKQKIHYTNYFRCRWCQWHSTSGKYTHPSQNPAT